MKYLSLSLLLVSCMSVGMEPAPVSSQPMDTNNEHRRISSFLEAFRMPRFETDESNFIFRDYENEQVAYSMPLSEIGKNLYTEISSFTEQIKFGQPDSISKMLAQLKNNPEASLDDQAIKDTQKLLILDFLENSDLKEQIDLEQTILNNQISSHKNCRDCSAMVEIKEKHTRAAEQIKEIKLNRVLWKLAFMTGTTQTLEAYKSKMIHLPDRFRSLSQKILTMRNNIRQSNVEQETFMRELSEALGSQVRISVGDSCNQQ